MIAEAADVEIVPGYITARGLSVVPDVLRGHRALAYYDDDGRFVGKFPAMIASVIGPDGAVWLRAVDDNPAYRNDMESCYAYARGQVEHDVRIESDAASAFDSE